jgi:hypothetical protein
MGRVVESEVRNTGPLWDAVRRGLTALTSAVMLLWFLVTPTNSAEMVDGRSLTVVEEEWDGDRMGNRLTSA